MRVIAGILGGRQFASPHSHNTHPMSDRARGALFNVLGDISGLQVLDAFSGSGALAFEAISRGAESVLAIDSDRAAQRAIEQNIRDLGVANKVKLVKASTNAWLQTNPENRFDIILCDPPYEDLQPNLLKRLADRVLTGGIVVLSLPPNANTTLSEPDYELVAHKDYGDAQLFFYRRG